VRSNSSNKQEEDLVAPEGEGRMLASTGSCAKKCDSSLPSMPCEHAISVMLMKTHEGQQTLLTVLKCHVRSQLKQEQLQANGLFVIFFIFNP